MNIYIDFDGTLFDTARFYSDFIKLCKKYKVDESSVYNIRNKNQGLFNLDELAKEVKEKYNLSKRFLAKVDDLYNKKYLYNDVMPFLKKRFEKYNLYILSYGEKEYQEKKIKCCRFNKYFKKVIITTDKGSLDIDYENSWFIDNNPKEIERLSSVGAKNIIRIKRYDDYHFSVPCNIEVKECFALSSIDVI